MDTWVHISLFSDSAPTSSSDMASSQFQESVWVAADGLHGDLDSALWYSQSAGIASYDHYSEHLWKPWQDPSDNIHPWVDTSDNSFDYPPYYPLLLSLDSPPLPIEHSCQTGDGESSLGSIPVQLPLPLAPGPVHHGKNGSAHQTDTPPHDYRVNDRYLPPVPSPLNDTAASIAGLPSSHHAELRGCLLSTYKSRSESRGLFTLLVALIAFLLVLNDLGEYIWGWPDYEFSIDTTSDSFMDVNVDIVVNTPIIKKVTANLHITTLGHGYASSTHVEHDKMNLTHAITEFRPRQLARPQHNHASKTD
ncbi:hypothetical protein EDD15DRAFT_2374215 [Pisolithus albus]|nr:hypothetical protein EDD15DRAFT_2374215 [Pisolithus albus]